MSASTRACGTRPRKWTVVGDALLRGLLFERAAQRAVAGDGEVDGAALAAQLPEGRDQVADALALDQVARP